MAAKPPPTATTILATPIGNIEDSRAQRLQRQQSRFRDRGGIFIPSSRNTLADILLGKASPVKKLRRSVSVSPSKGRRKPTSEKRGTPVHEENLRRSPRKQRRSLSVASGAGGSRPVSVVSSHRGSKALVASRKASSEPVTRETPTNASNEVDENSALVKGASGKKTPASRRAKKSTSSKAKAPKSTKKVAKPSENHEENPSRSRRTRANAKKSSADLMDGHASEPMSQAVSSVASSKASISGKPSNSRKTSHSIPTIDKGEEEGAPKRRKKPAAKKSQSSSSSRKSVSKSSAPSKPSRSRAGVPQLPDIMEEDEGDALPPPSVVSSLNEDGHHESTTRKKRPVSVEDSLTDPDDRPRKRAKPARKDATVKKEKTKTSKRQVTPEEEPSPVQRKRRRVVEQDADADGKADKPAKRKKVVSESEKVDNSLKPKKNVAKPSTKSAPQAPKPKDDKAPTKTAKRKENSVAPTRSETPRVLVPSRRGLPKSILLRLQNSSAPHVVDDEPDPIDFLS